MIRFQEIYKAQKRISNYIVKTPILTSEILNKHLNAKIYFKCENFQNTGSFKFRGAANKILKFKEDRGYFPNKIVAVSSGNHAGAIAYLCQQFGIEALIFMEKKVSTLKIKAAKNYGAKVILTETRAEADRRAEKKSEVGYLFIHPSNDKDIICGQGTVCLEAIEELEEIDAVFVACGGGGLAAGSYIAAQILEKKPKIFAVEPEIANDAVISVREGKIFNLGTSPDSIADGARTPKISEFTFPYLKRINGIFEASEEEIIKWTQIVSHDLEIVIEPTAALAMAGCAKFLEKRKIEKELKILVILSGGNMSAETSQIVWKKNYLDKN
ncbi:MAG: threonine dehydratase [Lentimonas sp.]|jgi:threonine dehydratase